MTQRTATTTPEQIRRLITLALESSLEDGEMLSAAQGKR